MSMITQELVFRTVLSFLIAGTWISSATLLSEKLGSRIGGLITNLPSNIVVSLVFIALTKGTAFTAEAARVVPLGMAITTVFMVVFVLVLPRGIIPAVASSLGAWLALAFAASAFPIGNLGISLAVYLVSSVIGFLLVEYGTKIRSVPKQRTPFSFRNQLIRAFFAGSLVASAVIIAQVSPPHVTGIAASFPAVMLSTLIILNFTQGPAFTRATGKILIISSSNLIVYVFSVSLLYPLLGILWGTVASFCCAILWLSLFLPVAQRMR